MKGKRQGSIRDRFRKRAARKEYQLAPQLKPSAEGVQKELIIFSPYFVPGEAGTDFLTGLVARGVRVRILTNSLASNDVSIGHALFQIPPGFLGAGLSCTR